MKMSFGAFKMSVEFRTNSSDREKNKQQSDDYRCNQARQKHHSYRVDNFNFSAIYTRVFATSLNYKIA